MTDPLLYYQCFGEGEPLFILHGFLGMSDNWMTIGKKFAEKFRVILPDLRNHGRSSHSNEFSLEGMARDIIQLADNLDIQSFNIIGHSMGGRVAMMVAANFPDRVIRGEVIDISPFQLPSDNTHIEILNMMDTTPLDNAISMQEVEAKIRNKILDGGIVQMCLKNVKRTNSGGYEWKPNVRVMLKDINNLRAQLPSGSMFKGPILFIKGEKSPYLEETELPNIKEYFPLATFITIKNAGHWVHVDAPEELINVTQKFLA